MVGKDRIAILTLAVSASLHGSSFHLAVNDLSVGLRALG